VASRSGVRAGIDAKLCNIVARLMRQSPPVTSVRLPDLKQQRGARTSLKRTTDLKLGNPKTACAIVRGSCRLKSVGIRLGMGVSGENAM